MNGLLSSKLGRLLKRKTEAEVASCVGPDRSIHRIRSGFVSVGTVQQRVRPGRAFDSNHLVNLTGD